MGVGMELDNNSSPASYLILPGLLFGLTLARKPCNQNFTYSEGKKLRKLPCFSLCVRVLSQLWLVLFSSLAR